MAWRLQRPADRDAFRARYGPWALVAGASEGIGAAFANALAELGLDLVLVARRPAPLETQAAAIRARHGVEVALVAADLGQEDVLATIGPAMADRAVGLVVYNAAASTIGPFVDASPPSRLASVHVNCRGPLLLLPPLIDGMRARGRGGIVLMSSVSGVIGTAMVTTYAATKAFTQVLGEGLWEELRPHGIDVVVSVAGAVSTPGFLASTPAAKRSAAYPITPEEVARDALTHLRDGPVTIPGLRSKLAVTLLTRILGRRRAVRFISARTRRLYER
ncbi:MAG: SDR family NAD(P)-dependent oxidoreductase [Sandaracinaceae bacterium]